MRCSARAAGDWLSPSAARGFLFQLPGLPGLQGGQGGRLFGPPFLSLSPCARADWTAGFPSFTSLRRSRATLALPSSLSSILRPPFLSSAYSYESNTLFRFCHSLVLVPINIVNSTPSSVLHGQFSTSIIHYERQPGSATPPEICPRPETKTGFLRSERLRVSRRSHTSDDLPPHNGGVATRRITSAFDRLCAAWAALVEHTHIHGGPWLVLRSLLS